MTQLGTRATLVLASDNAGKLSEISLLLNDLPDEIRPQVKPQSAFGLSTPEETGASFAENALLKARHACAATGHAAIADDSGLIVDALDGEPGIYSARYAGENATAQANMDKLLERLKDTPATDRGARFFCAIACVFPHRDAPIEVAATWEGRIENAPRGANGFGYDPIFFVPNENCTAAELSPEVKRSLSHRGQAMRLLRDALVDALRDAANDGLPSRASEPSGVRKTAAQNKCE